MEERTLQRKLTFWHIWAMGVGAVVGDGIFLLIAQGAAVGGPASCIAYLIAGILLMVVCMAISEMAVGMPSAGSLHIWSRRMLGPLYGTIAGLSETAMNIIFLGSVSLAAGALSNYFFQWPTTERNSAIIWALLLIAIVVLIAIFGCEITGRTQLILVLVLASIMLLFAIGGVFSGKIDLENYKPFLPYGLSGVWQATGMGIYAYMGPLVLLTTGEEAKNVGDLPKGMFWAFITFLILYTSAQVVMLGLVKYTEYTYLESPFVFAASKVFGVVAGLLINLAAWIAAFTCLIGEVFCASRLLYGMAKDGVLPQAFTKINKHGVPWVGAMFAWLVAIVIIMIANIRLLEEFYLTMCMAGSAMGVICFLISTVSSYRYPKLFYNEWKSLSWHLPARSLLIPVAFIACFLAFYAIYSSDPISIIYTGVILAFFIIFYYTYSARNLKNLEEDKSK